MKAYHDVLRQIIDSDSVWAQNRTGVPAKAIAGAMIQHDMADGFPLLTTKRVPFKLVASELEFFLRGITDKQWLIDRNNHIWDEWARPSKAPYGHDEESKKRMREEMDLGPIYGYQWRHFDGNYSGAGGQEEHTGDGGVDQIQRVIDKLHSDPTDRRMIVSAWNPKQIHDMGLPPCHIMHQINVINGRLNLAWYQRSCDMFLGVPFNIASYALLLHLYAKEAGLKEGILTGFLMDAHIYQNHVEQVQELLSRDERPLPKIATEKWNGMLNWSYEDSVIEGYNPHAAIKAEIAV